MGLASSAGADIKVRAFTSSGSALPALSQDGIASGTAITITLTSTTARIFVFDGDSTVPNESIGPVTINGTTSVSTLFFVIANPSTGGIPAAPDDSINPASPLATYAVNFGGLSFQNTSEAIMTVFCAQISGDVTGNITAGKIRRLVAGGSISATLLGTDDLVGGSPGSTNNYAIGRVQAASVTSAGRVRTTTSSGASSAGIYRVQLSGSLLGPVNADGGRIGIIDIGQDINLSGSNLITARDDIDSIEANTITVPSVQVTGSSFGIGRIKARTGAFTGGIVAPRLRNNVTDPGLQINGALTGNISIGTSGSFGNVLSPIIIGSMATTATIRVSGDVRANITSGGSLGRLLVDGSIGVAGTPITVTAAGTIGEIQALSVTGNISSTVDGVGPVAVTALWTGSLDVSTVASLSVPAWTSGVLKLRNQVLSSTTLTVGNVSATASVECPGGLAGKIIIANSLLGSLTLPSGGLIGQVIVNASNGSGVWSGNVTVGSTTLSPTTNYPNTESSLGGGAVGLVPFRLHATDSVPGVAGAPGGALPFGAVKNGSQTIRLRHYGPVKVGVSGAPVKVEYLAPYTSVWQDVSTQFTYGFGNSSRDVILTAIDTLASPFTLIGQFRVSPVNLVCDQVTGSPAVANYPEPSGTAGTRGFSYFTVGCSFSGNPNPCDISGSGATYDSATGTVDVPPDGQATIEDFLIFLAAFGDGTGCPSSTNTSCNPADITGAGATWPGQLPPPDGDLKIEDFIIFNNSFGDGCDGT